MEIASGKVGTHRSIDVYKGSSPNYRIAFIRVDTNSIVYMKKFYAI